MIAVIDSGNTRLHYSAHDFLESSELTDMVSVPYPESLDSLRTILSGLYDYGGKIEKIAACSVSSKWRGELFETLNEMFPGKLAVARTAEDIGVKVPYENPETYGVDRALAAFAAYRYFGDSCVVVDAGTAVTVDAVGSDGAVIGGYIFPGKAVVADALSDGTDLPSVSGAGILNGIGNSTETCIEFGISMGYRAAVRHLIESASDRAGNGSRVMLTGGNAGDLENILPFPAVMKPGIVLEGLGILADMLPKY
jgi:type III pantothenate kinase